MKIKLLGLILLSVIGLNSAPAFVDLTKAQTGSPVTSFDVNHTVAQGNTLIVVVACSTSGITYTMTSATGTYQQDLIEPGGGIDDTIAIWSSGNLNSGTHTITIGVSASEFVRYAVMEWSGIADSSRVIDFNPNTGAAQSITTGNVTTGTANTLLFAAVRTDGDETAHGTLGVGTDYTLVYPYAAVEPEQKLLCEYRIVGAGTYGANFTQQFADGGGWVAGLVAYAPSGADAVAPTLSSATIPSGGTSISLAFSETVSVGAGGNGGWTISMTGGAATLTYSSGSGTSTLVYSINRTINVGETGTVAYTQPGNGIEDTAGNDLATIATSGVTNNSSQGGGGGTTFGSGAILSNGVTIQ